MSPAARARLEAAKDEADTMMQQGRQPIEIIVQLVHEHGAIVRRGDPNRLRCCGVAASCTWSVNSGLLEAWRKNATLRIMKENLA